jgi:hypothetical protein
MRAILVVMAIALYIGIGAVVGGYYRSMVDWGEDFYDCNEEAWPFVAIAWPFVFVIFGVKCLSDVSMNHFNKKYEKENNQ